MAKAFTALVGEVVGELADTAYATWTAAFIGTQLEKSLKDISVAHPYVIRESYRFETRYGTASTTSATASVLVDTPNAQFGSGDVGKEVFNLTDRTWAKITAFTSTAQVSLSKDIMAINEQYEIYNEDCHDQRQLNLKNVVDYIGTQHGIDKVVYPVDRYPEERRNFKLEGNDENILTVELDSKPPNSKESEADVECFVFFNTRQRVSQLTDLAAALSASAAVGATTIALTGCQSAGTIKEGDMFSIANVRGLYRVTADTAIASSASSAVTFWPGLDSNVANSIVVSFVGSTLSPILERIAVDMTVGYCMVSGEGAVRMANDVVMGGAQAASNYYAMGQARIEGARRELRAMVKPRTSREYSSA